MVERLQRIESIDLHAETRLFGRRDLATQDDVGRQKDELQRYGASPPHPHTCTHWRPGTCHPVLYYAMESGHVDSTASVGCRLGGLGDQV